MLQTHYLLFSTFLITCFASCAQTNYLADDGFRVSFATFTEQMPGNIPVDANGNDISAPFTKKYIVYLGSSSANIKWENAWIGREHYLLENEVIEVFPYNAGEKKSTGEKIFINKEKDMRVWKLKLHPAYDNMPVPEKESEDKIILQGSLNGKKIIRKIEKVVEIESIPAV